MGVYIKGMEMPTDCDECWKKYHGFGMVEHDEEWGTFYCKLAKGFCSDLRTKCPLLPVPPHGRLIDADAYEELIRGLGNREYRRENGTICDAIKFLHPHYAPTIIPAEEAKDTNVPTYDLLYEEGGAGTT